MRRAGCPGGQSCYLSPIGLSLYRDIDMRIAIIGQQDFGKAVLNAFLARGDDVAAVFCAPEKPGARPDALRLGAEERGVPVHQFPRRSASGRAPGFSGAQNTAATSSPRA